MRTLLLEVRIVDSGRRHCFDKTLSGHLCLFHSNGPVTLKNEFFTILFDLAICVPEGILFEIINHWFKAGNYFCVSGFYRYADSCCKRATSRPGNWFADENRTGGSRSGNQCRTWRIRQGGLRTGNGRRGIRTDGEGIRCRRTVSDSGYIANRTFTGSFRRRLLSSQNIRYEGADRRKLQYSRVLENRHDNLKSALGKSVRTNRCPPSRVDAGSRARAMGFASRVLPSPPRQFGILPYYMKTPEEQNSPPANVQ